MRGTFVGAMAVNNNKKQISAHGVYVLVNILVITFKS